MAIFEITDYATLVQKASIVEAGSDQMQKDGDGKKRKSVSMGGGSTGGNFPSKFNRGTVSQPVRNPGFRRPMSASVSQGGRQSGVSYSNQSRPPLPDCKMCGKKHTDVCLQRIITCFKC